MLEYCCTILRAVPLPQEKSSPRKLPCTLRTRTCRRTLCWQVCGVRVFAAIPLPTVGPGATAGAVRADRSPVQAPGTRPQKAAAVSGLRRGLVSKFLKNANNFNDIWRRECPLN